MYIYLCAMHQFTLADLAIQFWQAHVGVVQSAQCVLFSTVYAEHCVLYANV